MSTMQLLSGDDILLKSNLKRTREPKEPDQLQRIGEQSCQDEPGEKTGSM